MRFDAPDRLYFFFDYISHNAYLAWQCLPPLLRAHGLTVEPVPVLFAGMLSHYKQVGPAELPAKSRWMLWNVLRKAQRLGIPIAPPHSHPFNPLLPLRLSCAAEGAARVRLVDRLFRATWAESIAVCDPAEMPRLLRDAGTDPDALVAEAQSEPVKRRLREYTDGALAAGAFGVPTFLVRGELFWGFDDLENLRGFLEGKDPLPVDRSAYAAWFDIRPSAERPR